MQFSAVLPLRFLRVGPDSPIGKLANVEIALQPNAGNAGAVNFGAVRNRKVCDETSPTDGAVFTGVAGVLRCGERGLSSLASLWTGEFLGWKPAGASGVLRGRLSARLRSSRRLPADLRGAPRLRSAVPVRHVRRLRMFVQSRKVPPQGPLLLQDDADVRRFLPLRSPGTFDVLRFQSPEFFR